MTITISTKETGATYRDPLTCYRFGRTPLNSNVYVIFCAKCGLHHDRRIACGTLANGAPKS